MKVISEGLDFYVCKSHFIFNEFQGASFLTTHFVYDFPWGSVVETSPTLLQRISEEQEGSGVVEIRCVRGCWDDPPHSELEKVLQPEGGSHGIRKYSELS